MIKQRLVGNKYPLIEINGIKISTKFLKFLNNQWMRICTNCLQAKSPTKEFFIIKSENILDRICRDCRKINLLRSDEDRECTECGFIGKATSDNFYTNRGILMRVCLTCRSKRLRRYVNKYQEKSPRLVWESRKVSSAKMRSQKRNQEFDETAVRELTNSYIEDSPCPCCHQIMNSKRPPSMERFDSTKGYVRGNIIFICYRCNFLKSDASLEELENIVSWMKKSQF